MVTTWLRKNVFPNDSPQFCGCLGYGALGVTEDLVREADVVLAVGCRFSEFTTGRWTLLSPGCDLIQVDIDPDSLGRSYVPAIGICADAAQATSALADAAGAMVPAPDPARAAWLVSVRAEYQRQAQLPAPGPAPGSGRVSSAALVSALRTVLGRTRATVVQDAPSLGVWIQRYLDFSTPGS